MAIRGKRLAVFFVPGARELVDRSTNQDFAAQQTLKRAKSLQPVGDGNHDFGGGRIFAQPIVVLQPDINRHVVLIVRIEQTAHLHADEKIVKILRQTRDDRKQRLIGNFLDDQIPSGGFVRREVRRHEFKFGEFGCRRCVA